MKMNKKSTIVFICGVVVALVLANLVSLNEFFRIDLTRDQKFTLSQASIDTVRNLKDTVTVSAYFTERLPPPYAQHARYVQDLLEEYLAASTGKFAYVFTDPTKEETELDREKKKELRRDIFGRLMREPTSVETQLGQLGVQPVEIRVIEGDQQQTKRAYMGIVIRFQDQHEVIPVVQNLADLEKDITSLMRKLTRERAPRIGIIKDPSGPQIEKVREALKKNVQVEEVDLSADGAISSDLDAIMVVGLGSHLGEQGAQKIHNFLAEGKSGALFLDRYKIDPRSFQKQENPQDAASQAMLELLTRYGIEIESSLVADASCASLNMQENRDGFVFSLPVKYPFVPELMNLSYESPVTKGLSGVILPFVASLNVTETAGLDKTVLAQSSKVSWLESEPLDLNPKRNWSQANISPDGPHPLIVQARGTLPATSAESEAASDGDATALESRLIVMGTSSFMWDDFLAPPNQVLALNIVDWMLADSALLEMRTREFSDTPLDNDLSDSVRQAVKFGNILGVPFLLVMYGLIRWRFRESRRRSLKK